MTETLKESWPMKERIQAEQEIAATQITLPIARYCPARIPDGVHKEFRVTVFQAMIESSKPEGLQQIVTKSFRAGMILITLPKGLSEQIYQKVEKELGQVRDLNPACIYGCKNIIRCETAAGIVLDSNIFHMFRKMFEIRLIDKEHYLLALDTFDVRPETINARRTKAERLRNEG